MMFKKIWLILLTVVLIAVVAPVATAAPLTGTCVRVEDGDTIEVEVGDKKITVQLAEIDAPELDQPSGSAAREALTRLVLDQEVTLKVSKDIAVGEVFARVSVGGRDVSLELVNEGLAWTPDSRDEQLVVATIMARGSKKGLWAATQPMQPWLWRTRQPPTPTPGPVFVARRLSDAGKVVELKKDESGRTVIAGLPQKAPSEDDDDDDEPEGSRSASGYQVDFRCDADDAQSCMEQSFRRNFSEAYPGDSAGSFTVRIEDHGDGSITAMFQGQSGNGATYTVGSACTCSDEGCGCMMSFGPVVEIDISAQEDGA